MSSAIDLISGTVIFVGSLTWFVLAVVAAMLM